MSTLRPITVINFGVGNNFIVVIKLISYAVINFHGIIITNVKFWVTYFNI